MELRSHVESSWSKRLLEWLKVRVSNSSGSGDGCEVRDLLDKAQELQHPEAEKADLDAVWLYNWNYENDIFMKATKELPQSVKMEDVVLHYVVSCKDRNKSTEQSVTNNGSGLRSAKRSRSWLAVGISTEARKKSDKRSSSSRSANENQKMAADKPSTGELAVKKRAGKKLIASDLDRELWQWYSNCKSRGKKVSVNVVRARARFVFANAGHKNFKASEGWYRKWMRRWKVVDKNRIDRDAPLSKESFAGRSAGDLQNDNVPRSDLKDVIKCGNPSSTIEENHLEIMDSLQPQHPIESNKDDMPVETSSTGLDFMDVDFSLPSRSSDQACLASNFASCLADATEISGLTLPSVGEDSRDLTSGVIMGSLNLTSSDTLDLRQFMSVDRGPRLRNCANPGDHTSADSKRKGGCYQEDFKRHVVNYATSKKSFKEAAVKYGVHCATVSQWCREKQMAEDAGNKRLAPIGNRTEGPDKRFIDWIRECRTTGVDLRPQCVHSMAQQLIDCHTAEELEKSCKWFAVWMKRLTDIVYEEGMEDQVTKVGSKGMGGGQLIQYPSAFKEEVTAYAELRCMSWAARVFNVSRRRVAEWMAHKDMLRRGKAGRKVTSFNAEKQIWEWYLGQRAVGCKPKGNEIREKATHIFATLGISNVRCSSGWLKCFCRRFGVKLRNNKDDDLVEWVLEQFEQNLTVTHTDLQIHGVSVASNENSNFKASAGWSIRFCRRHPKLLREVATVDVLLPAQLEDRVNGFRLWIRNVLQQNGLMLAAIGCMDEVALTFRGCSPAEGQKRPPLMRRTGLENASAVVCLTILADGSVLPPLILLKGPHQSLTQPDIPQDKQHLIYMDELKVTDEVLQKWMDDIWLRHVPSPALLVFDGFAPHLALRSKMTSAIGGGHDVAVIPASCSSKLQPLDVHLRTAFLDCVNDAYVRWTNHIRVSSGASSKPAISPPAADILNFVTAGHRLVCQKQEIVRRSFVVTGITTASDGSQDHLVDDATWAVAEM